VSDLENSGYWAGWYDSLVAFGHPPEGLIVTCEGRDWYERDVAMLAALNG